MKKGFVSLVAVGVLALLTISSSVYAEAKNEELSKKLINHHNEKTLPPGVIDSLKLKQLKLELKSSGSFNRMSIVGKDTTSEDPLFEKEPNDDFSTANSIVGERAMVGQLLPWYDFDLFKVNVPSEGILVVGGVTNSYAIELLFAAFEEEFEENGFIEYLGSEYEDDVEMQFYQVNKAGNYYIGAFDYDNEYGIDDNTAEDLYAIQSVFIDDVEPEMPIVNEVTTSSTSVSGTAEVGSTVRVKKGETTLGSGKSSRDGNYSVSIALQQEGTVLTVTSTDSAGNVSREAKVTVTKDMINRIAGTSRYSTAVAISQEGWKTAETVVLATGVDFPDALAGGPLAYKENAPILLTKPTSLTAETELEIKRLKAKKVIILGSKGAISLEVEAKLKNMGVAVERIGGKNRFDTAALIAKRLPSNQAVIAYGFNFPDVLSISPYAAKNGVPILLTRTDKVPAETLSAMSGKTNTIIVGSIGAVNDSVMKQFPKPVRYGGKTRYDTGKEIITKLPMGTEKAYIATGRNFPDALAGSVLAARNNAPILLVNLHDIPPATNDLISNYDSFSIFGSEGAVGKEVKNALNVTLQNN